jgi:hypothetical protein
MTNSKFVALTAAVLITISQIILIGHYTDGGLQQAAVLQPSGDVESIWVAAGRQ